MKEILSQKQQIPVRMEEDGRRRSEQVVMMRKGPWMAEEDEILINYVNKYGPRDWSSIRSKGILPRTGKSCRLRWVNKLQPNLKTSGCKFSEDEEKMVIDLQARFGNKWARIATYLQGRTDNDVKNFWSTRQKRLARILRTSNTSKSHKNNGKTSAFREVSPSSEQPKPLNCIEMEEDSSSTTQPVYQQQSYYMEETPQVPVTPNLLNVAVEPNLPQLEYNSPMEGKPYTRLQPYFPFPQLVPQPTLDLPPFLPENQDHLDLMDVFGQQSANIAADNISEFPSELPLCGLEDGSNGKRDGSENPATPDSFFDDLPTDMFDYIESLPTSSNQW